MYICNYYIYICKHDWSDSDFEVYCRSLAYHSSCPFQPPLPLPPSHPSKLSLSFPPLSLSADITSHSLSAFVRARVRARVHKPAGHHTVGQLTLKQ